MRVSQKVRTVSRQLLAGCVLLALVGATAQAQQTTGVLGSPDATTTIDGRYLPPPPQKFEGQINLNAAQSKPAWPARVVPPKGAPNILLILTDDVGFGAPSTFGGVIPTPALDRIAANGLRYTNFHSTSLCSPTRAALITGRNHHSVGFGVISEIATGFPGYNSVIGKDSATIGRILLDNGYRTSWFGKNHNTPVYQTSQAGPFDQWPTGMGFEYFYGFMGGDADQWTPGLLFRNTTHVQPFVGNPKWNLITAMADDAIHWMNELNDINPDMPFFLYYAPGGTHSPHHPTQEWVDKISAMHLFDKGWNNVRDQIFANQKRLGVIPQDAKMTAWPKDMIKEWTQLTPVEQKLFIRQADVYGAYLAYTDHEIGRVIQEVENEGKLDNTLIIYISGDNGSSAEGSPTGTPERNHCVQRRRVDGRTADAFLPRLGFRRPTPIIRSGGPGRLTRRTGGPSRSRRTSVARNRAWRSPGPRRSRTRAAYAGSFTTLSTSCRRCSKRPVFRRLSWSTVLGKSLSKV